MSRARTYNEYGNDEGVFNTETRPTAGQVTELIETAADEVEGRVAGTLDGGICDEGKLHDRAKQVTALRVAMLIELSYYPEQTDAEQSAYREYKALYDELIESLSDAVARICGGDGEGSGDPDSPGTPSYDFDVTTTPLGREFPW